MNRIRALALLIAVLVPALAANAQLSISWYTIDGGGGTSTGGTFTLRATIGQHDAAPVMSGGTFSVSGGFWAAPPVGPACGTADFNGDGAAGLDDDIEAFFLCLGGDCCPTCGDADFNGDGAAGLDDDIESFFLVLGGGTCV